MPSMSQSRSGILPVAADALIAGSSGRGFYCSALLTPAAADAVLTIYDGPAANNLVVAQIKAVANGPTVGEQLRFPIPYVGGNGVQGLLSDPRGAEDGE